MKPPITKLVDKIIRKLQQGDAPSEAGIRTWLKTQGYPSKDVEAAIAVLRPEWGVSASAIPQQTRVLSPYEAYFITPEAMAALSRLELYGLIGTAERELILERLDQFDGEMDIAALEYLISSQVCPGFDIAHQQMFYQVLDGRTDTYH